MGDLKYWTSLTILLTGPSNDLYLKKSSNKTTEVDQSAALQGLKVYGQSQRQLKISNKTKNQQTHGTVTEGMQMECSHLHNTDFCERQRTFCNAPLVLTAPSTHLPGETLAPFHISTVAPRLPRLSAFLLFPTYLSILR